MTLQNPKTVFKDPKNIVILILVIALAVVSWIAFKKEPSKYDESHIQAEIDTLNSENTRLLLKIAEERSKVAVFLGKIDSLQALKPKVITIYENNTKRIDDAGSAALVAEFKSIFPDNIH